MKTPKGWRSMKSAPTDDTVIMGILAVYKRGTAFIQWERHLIAFDPEAGEMSAQVEYTGWEWNDFQYWHPLVPLPPPPQDLPR